ncbi:MAG: O-acetylhomoserine sulfhydrylase [SAR324 cluster bacterium]|uniref:O-acetylhomoserine sulfhydrylase n=1 Tax=SAR324 cluster bacterium TaxID=2024889 RepID=A0A2A4T5W2_9DELT|nr:MAG: O-acetylhomoserine sulfhydrylase [SAR324 cluster bacterium]
MKGFSTKAIHGMRFKKDVHGALRTPVYDNVAFEYETSRDIQLAFEGKKPGHSYSRISNPTVDDFEQRVRLISNAMGVIAVSSGMAAIADVILTLAETGTNIVSTKSIFGNTYSLFEHTLKHWGLEVRYVSMNNPEEVEQAIDENTRAVFLEAMTNPGLEIADFEAIGAITKARQVPLIVDSTVTTPYLFQGKKFGVNIEILSSTKYISGGATSVGGLIIDHGNFNWKQSPKLVERAKTRGPMALISALRQEVYRNMGSCLSAHNAYLQSLGLETLSLRVNQSCANTKQVAEFLDGQDAVVSVHYPGLKSSPYYELGVKYFGGKGGGILTFDLESQEACFQFMDALKLIKRATNVNDNKTMIIHPYSTIFCEYSAEERLSMGVRPTMIRLSVGIEDLDDLQDDIIKGLEAI